MSSSRRFVRALADIRQDIDSFLDPNVLTLASRDPKPEIPEAEPSISAAATSELKLQVLGLRSEGDVLMAKYEDARQDAEACRLDSERRAGSDAAEMARLRMQREDLQDDGRAKKRRAQEAEERAFLVAGEKNIIVSERDNLHSQLQAAEIQQRRLEEEGRQLREDLARARALARSDAPAPHPIASEFTGQDALRETIATLEQENVSLRLILDQGESDRQLSSQLRTRHAEYEEELAELRVMKTEFSQLRAHSLKLEQEETALRAALETRSAAMRAMEDLAQDATSAKHDLAAFIEASASIIADVGTQSSESSVQKSSVSPTPVDLSLAWTHMQNEVGVVRRQYSECQQNLDQALQRERHCQSEIVKLRSTLATTRAELEEQRLDLRRARDESATLKARTEVLREALAKRGTGEASPSISSSGDLKAEAEAAKRRADDFEQVVKVKQSALDSLSAELESLRQQNSKLSDIEATAKHLQRVNEDLSNSNSTLERDQERLVGEINAAKREAAAGSGARDYDPSTTKVLHFRHGPGACFSSKGGSHEIEALRAELHAAREEIRNFRFGGDVAMPDAVAAGDLESRQVSRQFERFKKATKKYVQDYREGVYGLLGWKVEMKGEGNSLKWHLTSRYHIGEELVFHLRPGEGNSPPEFDLLKTSWGEQLQDDRHAMAFLEVYRSIPGFLAHITTEYLARQTI
jgi:hypothetical protein